MDGPPLDIAVVGMAALFPGAPDLETYWRNIRSGFDAITDVPPGRWDPAFYDPASQAVDRLYCKRGGFVDAYATFDALGFGVMPVAVRGTEPDQLLTLQVSTRAIADAGYDSRPFARQRAGFILGRGGYASAARTRLEQFVRTAEQLVVCLRALVPSLSEEEIARVKRDFQAQVATSGADTAIGVVPNLAASRVANRLDLGGPTFTVDAACASSLVAIDQACRELASRRCDLMLAGGVHLCHDESFWSGFCQLGAMSHNQQIRPFDRKADGLLVGEGIGVVVLKRLADAQRDDDRIYAVIRGMGVASDGHGTSLAAPRVEGQVLALERAWAEAGIDPRTVGLIEAHGTATRAGDDAEIASLRRFFGESSATADVGLGSVKSMIGHAMPAAGAAGFIKAVLAVHHGVLPPTLHCEEPMEALQGSRFRIVTREEPWDGRGPRRAGVNAFGFGGINAHAVVEEYRTSKPRAATGLPAPREANPTIAVYYAPTADALLADLRSGSKRASREGAARLAVIDPTPARLERARTVVEKGRPWRGREGIYFTPRGLLSDGGRVAVLFPGVDASFVPRVDDVCARFGHPLPACTVATTIEETGLGIIGVNRLLYRILTQLGVRADFLAGHSIGEWSGMVASGMVPEDAAEALLERAKGGTLEVPGVFFAAAGCGVDAARAAMQGLTDIDISHDNCPHQILLCGRSESVDIALERLREGGVICHKLSFQSGFHSPLFASFVRPHAEAFAAISLQTPTTPLWSATACTEFPRDPDEIRALAIDHLVKPVRFRELILALYEQGARVFVQAGTGSVVNFVEDTLRGRPHLAISANVKEKSGLEQLRHLVATLLVEGADVRDGDLFDRTDAAGREPMRLALGVPLVRPAAPIASLEKPATVVDDPSPQHPLAAEFTATLGTIARAQADVLAAFDRASRTPAGPLEATTVRRLSIETFPELRDHTFYRQPPGWPTLSDLHPVAPMTMSVDLMREAAEALVPGRVVVAIESVRAYKWLAVAQPVDATIRAAFDGRDRVAVSIEGYADCECVVAESYPPAPDGDTGPIENGRTGNIGGRKMYDDRWMFHGPAYQGIADVSAIGDRAVRGEVDTPPGRGGLLDNAGQLFGYWAAKTFEIDKLCLPVTIARLRFFGPPPRLGERTTCTVRIRRHGEREVIADLSIDRDGKAWAQIEGWEDRRLETDARLWPVMVFPEQNVLAEPQDEGFVVFVDRYRSAPTREQLSRRFLGEAERAQYHEQGPRKQRAWLSGRIAAKDAVRHLLWQDGHGALFPVEVTIASDSSGAPLAIAPSTRPMRQVHVSIAHKDDVAVAMASYEGDIGIDIERIEPRTEGFIELAFTADELRLAEDQGNGDKDESLTRLWVAKEAAAKAARTGLSGDPRRFPVTDRAENRFLVAGRWVMVKRFGDYVIGWTQP
jgi:acyl transferase domain-containing protein/phosphopantetheinyl transferase